MEAIVNRPQPRFEHVRVDLRRRQIGMTEHQLNGAEIGAALEQMRRERMPQYVRAERRGETGPAAVLLEDLPETDAAERTAARVDEKRKKVVRNEAPRYERAGSPELRRRDTRFTDIWVENPRR